MTLDPVTFLLLAAAAQMGGLDLDIVTRVINIQWGGLAVEFFDGADGQEPTA